MKTKKVPQSTISKWKASYNHGDYNKIAEAVGVHRATIHKAFRGYATEEVAASISQFYNPKHFLTKQNK